MSDVSVSCPRLKGLVLESSDSDYAADGFHQRHTAAAEQVAPIANAFREQGYVLEMITCEDRREDLEHMRLV